MISDWGPLRHILAQYRDLGARLPIWWRDDDAVSATKALERLAALSDEIDLNVHIAVIPDLAEPSLASAVANTARLVPVVHGWRHENHAPPDAKKSEFGQFRQAARQEFLDGLSRLDTLFGDRLVRLFVPPWNRIDPILYPDLKAAGLCGISTFGSRKDAYAAPGLMQINTHIDPIDWHGTRDLRDPAHLIGETVDLLEKRLRGDADNSEPLGYLTHHLVHSEHLWDFSRQLLLELLEGGATPHPITPMLETSE